MTIEQRIGDYDIESILGRGSIGKVYLARHRRLGRRVALKTVHYDPTAEDNLDDVEFYKRLQREAELCAAMQHPNIVTLYEAGYEGDRVTYLATEYVEGETLLALLKRTRPLPLEIALSIGSDLLRALVYAHAKGVIHRDIKPANILLTPDGQAKITDFGIARPIDSSLTVTGSLLGTPNYMSPEQVKSTPVTPRSDLFSAGAVMYEMLTGVKPFAAPELSGILYNVVNLEPPLASTVNPGVPDGISQVVAKLLAKSPPDRYATAGDALQELDRERAAIETLPAAEEYGTLMPSRDGDATTPLPTVRDLPIPIASSDEATSTRQPGNTATRQALLKRPVPAPLFWSVTGALLVALFFSGAAITSRHAPPPEVTIPRETQQELVAKRRALEAARAFSGAGQYDEAVRRYDEFLARYPNSPAARAEREDAQRLLAASQRAEEKVTVTAKRRRPAAEVAEAPPPEEPPKPPGRWERVKRWFRGPEQPKKP